MPPRKKNAELEPTELKRPVGRPSKFTQELADYICEEMMNGRDLVDICTDETMPARSTVYRWLAESPSFATQYAHAREALADLEMAHLKAMADATTEANVNSSRVKLNHYQWRVMKIAPRLYGDRQRTELTGADGGPIQVKASTIDARQLEPEAREALKQALFAAKRMVDGD
jgi:hypothetical protein